MAMGCFIGGIFQKVAPPHTWGHGQTYPLFLLTLLKSFTWDSVTSTP